MLEIPTGREFQLWEYHISHGTMLIRSPKMVSVETNVDILAVGVEYLEVAMIMGDLRHVPSAPDVVERFGRILGSLGRTMSNKSVVTLENQTGQSFSFVAVKCWVEEHSLPIFDSPFRNSDGGPRGRYGSLNRGDESQF